MVGKILDSSILRGWEVPTSWSLPGLLRQYAWYLFVQSCGFCLIRQWNHRVVYHQDRVDTLHTIFFKWLTNIIRFGYCMIDAQNVLLVRLEAFVFWFFAVLVGSCDGRILLTVCITNSSCQVVVTGIFWTEAWEIAWMDLVWQGQ